MDKIIEEVYKSIPDYKNYLVSNLGNVKRVNFKLSNKEKELKKTKNKHGYYHVTLYSDIGKQKYLPVHQLVAIAFLNHVPNKLEAVVDHIDNNKLNNRVDNLQIVSHRYNISKDRVGKSSCVGVTRASRSNKWRAYIVINGIQKHLGSFETEEEACQKYNEALNTYLESK